MNTEERTQERLDSEDMHFDAHEFDGLRDDLAAAAEGWMKRAELFVRENPWLCMAVAAGVGCAIAYALRSGDDAKDAKEHVDDAAAAAEASVGCQCV